MSLYGTTDIRDLAAGSLGVADGMVDVLLDRVEQELLVKRLMVFAEGFVSTASTETVLKVFNLLADSDCGENFDRVKGEESDMIEPMPAEFDGAGQAKEKAMADFDEDNVVDAQFVQLPKRIRQALVKKGYSKEVTPLISPSAMEMHEAGLQQALADIDGELAREDKNGRKKSKVRAASTKMAAALAGRLVGKVDDLATLMIEQEGA